MRIAVMFSGQGSQYPRMAAGLYEVDPVFTEAVDRTFEWFGRSGPELRRVWLEPGPGELYDDVRYAQPLLWTINRALGELVMSWVRPHVFFGHSVGELVAATFASVLDPRDATDLMRDRVLQFADSPAGAMLAVAAGAADVEPVLVAGVGLAAVNGDRQVLIAGRPDRLDVAAALLADRGVSSVRARAKQAFHTPMVEDAALASVSVWERVWLAPPTVELFTTNPAGPTTPAQACDPVFWARQPALTVHFSETLDAVLASGVDLLVEAGPGGGLTALARRHPAVRAGRCEAISIQPLRPGDEQAQRDWAREAQSRLLRSTTAASSPST